jgi:hypothetical protein
VSPVLQRAALVADQAAVLGRGDFADRFRSQDNLEVLEVKIEFPDRK